MNKTLFCLFFLVCFVAGCQKQQTTVSKNKINIEVGDNPLFLSADSVFSDVTYIVLETTEESLFYDIDKIICYDSLFYLLDHKQAAIFVFDPKGKFVKKLHRKGQGSGEYLSIEDFFIKDGLLYVLTSTNKKIFVYDDNFDNVKIYPIDIFATNMEYLNDQIFIYSNFASYDYKNIYVLDINTGEIKNKYADFLKKQLGVCYSTSGFAKMQDSLFITFPYDYSIYNITSSGYSSYLAVDFGQKNMYPAKWIKYSDDERTDRIKSMYNDFWDLPVGRLGHLYLSEDFLIFTFIFRVSEHKYIRNQHTGKSQCGYIVESEQFPLANGRFLGVINDKIVISSNADNILKQVEYMNSHKFKINFKFNLQPADNPVLSIYTLKNQ